MTDLPTSALLFRDPPARLRGKPFWAWNAALHEDELRRQIRVFKDMGFGGFFMHARVGLDTPYLGREWFDCVRACIDEAQAQGMEAWLYDEDRWPSGSAGGLVTRDPAHRLRTLRVSRRARQGYEWPRKAEAAYVFAAVFRGDKLVRYARVHAPAGIKDLRPEAELVEFVLTTPACRCPAWFNGTGYLDTMDPEAVAAFIEVTHEAYRREVGEHFGKTVPGIFTDEPTHGAAFRETWYIDGDLPWTATLPDRFRELFGYDVTDHLPELAFDPLDRPCSQARYHYYRCTTRMFVESYAGQIGQWCDDHNLLLTGHVQEEQPISNNVSICGASMPFYAHMQAPGVDVLGRDSLALALKQCASVARQTGRQWMLSELYGCTGWETAFETYKHSGDWQAALGVTLRCPHLAWYSMAGEAKRDYPASIHFHSPWWRAYRQVEDYFSRLNVLLSAGDPVCDLAVIHPVESYYLLIKHDWVDLEVDPPVPRDDRIRDMDEQYDAMVGWLLGNHLDFDFVDEQGLVDFEAGAGQDNRGPRLRVGGMTYRAVLVPPVLTLRASTLERLKQFVDSGGVVVFAGDPPGLIDALPSAAATDLARGKTVPCSSKAVTASLERTVRRVSVRDADGREAADVLCQLRRLAGGWVLFLCNTSREREYVSLHVRLDAPLDAGDQLQLWDAAGGERYAYSARMTAGCAEFDMDLAPAGSALFVVASRPEELSPWIDRQPTGRALSIRPRGWEFVLDDHNVLVMDRLDCLAVAEDRPEFRRMGVEVLALDDEMRDYLGVPRRIGGMVQPWASHDLPPGPTAQVTLTYCFNVEVVPSAPLQLALEQPERWQVSLNGRVLDCSATDGWWVDPALATVPVDPAGLKQGGNTLTLKGSFDRKTNLEIVYLLGPFGVIIDGKECTVTRLPEALGFGSWCAQGLPFYSGSVLYRSTFQHSQVPDRNYVLELPDCRATAAEVSLNGSKPVLIGFPEYRLDITPLLRDGENAVDIRLISSRRNAFGPLHLAVDAPARVGPRSYRDSASTPQQDAFKLVDYGMYTAPVITEHLC